MSRSTTVYDSKKVLVRMGPHDLAPYEAGVPKHWHINLAWMVLIVIWAGIVGLFVWLIIEFEKDRKFFCESADLFKDNGYIKFQGRAAEPYTGRPTRVLTDVTSLTTCQSDCTSDSACRFFTHDLTHSKCYIYREGLLPEQNAEAAVPGPTNLNADVYVKDFERAVELRGVLKTGQ